MSRNVNVYLVDIEDGSHIIDQVEIDEARSLDCQIIYMKALGRTVIFMTEDSFKNRIFRRTT